MLEQPVTKTPAELWLEDGFHQEGWLYGGEASGEVVFTTVMTGYSEVASDPSYAGQIVVLTFPLVGVYGVPRAQLQAEGPTVAAFVVRELHSAVAGDIRTFLAAAGRPVLTGVDTRAVVRHLREAGTMRGVVSASGRPESFPLPASADLVRAVATRSPYRVGEAVAGTVALIDFGVKQDIVRECVRAGFAVHVLPPDSTAAEVFRLEPSLVLLSNGPGDPAELTEFLPLVRALAERLPTFGICLGHQLLALAFGARTYRLKYGHRGGNHPVRELETGRVHITSQNHGYAVDPASLSGTGLAVTHVHVNDGSVEGLRHEELPVWSLQYHPEAGPGPREERAQFPALVRRLEAVRHRA